ncbi:DsrE family protein [Beggiatoa leptomitoformis]|uniref:Uncharacterized protein n=1 Tax=Beggiatoa leptomitoformis TaxID=288004 RepID=A0A2N9YIQ2_9GAMM|nr:DsrE family protein [Beggiatoa leptomitoformis]ALG67408.1 hypothetical protein AL038_06440 [Beggiatoa leptomitoformis]AUI70380.1 hypothetical protein BLE401_17865 [Beggiatoa leptomitoformis]
MLKRYSLIILGLISLCWVFTAQAESPSVHKVVIQVSSPDPQTQQLALNTVANLLSDVGIDKIKIEVVAFGPGLSLLTPMSPESVRIPSLAMQNVTFSACGNTINGITRATGQPPVLVQGVQVVAGGVEHIIKLQEQGYSYIRP